MTTRVLSPPITAEEYEALPDRRMFELVDGALVERHVSIFSSQTSAAFMIGIGGFVKQQDIGAMFDAELGMRLHPDDSLHTRRADVGFISWDRNPRYDAGHLRVAPELVVEVISPGDVANEVRAKVNEWLDHGVRAVWVAFPEDGEIHVYAAGEHPRIFTATDEIDGGTIIPGFRASVADLFPRRPSPAK
jgi:Uma2 family endonuclease